MPGEFNRHFHLRPREAEIFQVYVLPEFRHLNLVINTGFYELRWLRDHGYCLVYARVESSARAWSRIVERVGFKRIGAITHVAFYCPKFKKRDGPA